MNIADLFIRLGISGADKAKSELGSVTKGIDSIVSSSLAAKAGLAGMLYGLEKMTGWASTAGMDLRNFSVLTGQSTDMLQQWQHAGRMYGLSADEMANSIKSLNQAMTTMKLTGQMPEGFGMMMTAVHMDPKRIDDTFYVLDKIQEYIKKAPPSLGTKLGVNVLGSEKVVEALKLINFARDKAKKEDLITKREINNLSELNRDWQEFWYKLEVMGKKTIASPSFKSGFDEGAKAVMSVVNLIDKLNKLSDGLLGVGATAAIVAKMIYSAFGPLGIFISFLTAQLTDINEAAEFEKKHPGEKYTSLSDKAMLGVDDFLQNITKKIQSMYSPEAVTPSGTKIALPQYAPGTGGTTIVHNHISGAQSPHEIAQEVQRTLARTAGQMRPAPATAKTTTGGS